ncbi:MAG: hypothetical protein CMJ77_05000 [Planctomycetaceae bacterium]|nr:hypothetical protein [Planctomycetaceae bacterium]
MIPASLNIFMPFTTGNWLIAKESVKDKIIMLFDRPPDRFWALRTGSLRRKGFHSRRRQKVAKLGA